MREPFPSPCRRLRAPRRRLRLSNRRDGSPGRRSERRVPAAKLQPFFQIFSIPFPFSVFSACFLLSFLRERPLSGKCRKNVVLRQFCFRFSRLSPSQRLFSAISSLRVRRTQRLFRNFATRVRLCLRHVGSWMPPAFSMPADVSGSQFTGSTPRHFSLCPCYSKTTICRTVSPSSQTLRVTCTLCYRLPPPVPFPH